MNFNRHFDLEGKHAFLGASSWHWLNYDEDKLISAYRTQFAKLRGTELHDYARRSIELGIKLPKSKKTLNMFVNDAIGYRMTPEQPLYYSEFCFGTADAISFKNNMLRIHDLKTGATPAHMEQLLIYAALFCLEYSIDPKNIDIELRIYQSDDIIVQNPEASVILAVMDKIIFFDKKLSQIQAEGV